MLEDIVIIGGGLGGLAAAKALADAGISALLLEKNNNLCQKPCGELMGDDIYGFSITDFLGEPRTNSRFNSRDFIRGKEDFINNQNIIEGKFDKIIVDFYGKEFIFKHQKDSHSFPAKVFSINKKKLHEYLAEKAIRKGARILLSKAVNKLERRDNLIVINNEIKTRLIIGADGFHSIVRKFVGQKQGKGIFAISVEAENQVDYPYLFFDAKIAPSGYGWIFPKRAISNAGVCDISVERAKAGLDRFIKIKKIKPKSIRGAFVSASLPSKTYFDNIMLVGEAANLTQPFWFAGINSALISGYLAAKTAKEALEKNRTDASFLKKYEKLWKKYMHKELLKAWLYQKIFYSFLIKHKTITSAYLRLRHEEIKDNH